MRGDGPTQQAAEVFDRCSLTLKEQTRAALRRTTDYTAAQQGASAPTVLPMGRRALVVTHTPGVFLQARLPKAALDQ